MARGRNANGSGTIRKRADGRWEAIYSLGNDPGTGKLIRKSVYGKTAEEVALKLRAATAAIDNDTYMEPERMTLREWMQIWLSEYIGDVKGGTSTTYPMYTMSNYNQRSLMWRESQMMSLDHASANHLLNRAINTHIANMLLPVFCSRPYLWAAIPSISTLGPCISFAQWFASWRTASPEVHAEGTTVIASVFGLTI